METSIETMSIVSLDNPEKAPVITLVSNHRKREDLLESLFELIKTGDGDLWLPVLLESDNERHIKFEMRKISIELDLLGQRQKILEFKKETYTGWIEFYEEQNKLQWELKVPLTAKEIKQACLASLAAERINARKAYKEVYARGNYVALPNGQTVKKDSVEAAQYKLSVDALFNQAEHELKEALENLTKDQPGNFIHFIKIFEKAKDHLILELDNIIFEQKPPLGMQLLDVLDKELKDIIHNKYKTAESSLEDQPYAFPEDLHETAGSYEEPVLEGTHPEAENISPVAKILSGCSFSPSIADRIGNTLLHVAILSDQKNTVKLLLEYGANPFLRNSEGISALMLAKESGKTEILYSMVKFLCHKPLHKEEAIEGKYIKEMSLSSSSTYYDMLALEDLGERSDYEKQQALEIWQTFLETQAQLNLAMESHVASRKSVLYRTAKTSKRMAQSIGSLAVLYEELYHHYKANRIDDFRRYFMNAGLPVGSSFRKEFQKFLNNLTYGETLNKALGDDREVLHEDSVRELLVTYERISTLENQVEKQARQIIKKDEKVKAFKEEIIFLSGELERKDEEIVALVNMNKDLAVRNDDLAAMNKDFAIRNDDLAAMNKDLTERDDRSIKENAELKIINEKLREQNKVLHESQRSLEARFEAFLNSQNKENDQEEKEERRNASGKGSSFF